MTSDFMTFFKRAIKLDLPPREEWSKVSVASEDGPGHLESIYIYIFI